MNTIGAERIWVWTAIAFALAFVVVLALAAADSRHINGESVWAKPSKFALATAIHYATLAAVVHFLGPEWRLARWLEVIAIASVLFAVFEVGYIAIQAGRAMPSHFNTDTPFYAAMYSLMAFGAVMVLLPALPVGIGALVDPAASLSMPLRLACAIGLVGGAVLTFIVAFRLGGNGSHFVGTITNDMRAMPLTGWSLTIGDLRPAHFFALHMMQVVPVAGLVLVRIFEDRLASFAVAGFALAWAAICISAFTTALAGRPFPYAAAT